MTTSASPLPLVACVVTASRRVVCCLLVIEVYIFGRGIFLIYMNVFICCFMLCSVLYMAM